MYRIDDPTAATSLPTPESAGTEGFFTEGNPATGTPATRVRGSWLNMIQEELRALVVAGGLTPNKTTYTQVRDAILTLLAKTALGQCYFKFVSATQCALVPQGGNIVTVNGQPLVLPSAGLTISNSGLAANTLYYAYLSGTTASPTLSFSTTGHSTAPNGVETMTGDTTKTLVGMVFANPSAQFFGGSGSNSQSVLSWFNRKTLCASFRNSGNGPAFTSGTLASIWPAAAISFCTWGDDCPGVFCNVGAQLTAATASMAAQLFIDGVGASNQSQWNAALSNGLGSLNLSAPPGQIAEGFHISTLMANVSSGTGGTTGILHQAFVRG